MQLALLLLPIAFQLAWTQVGQFYNPPNAPTDGSDYAEDVVWKVGETQTINYTTTYTNYTIAIWQQPTTGGSAILGEILLQTTSGHITSFLWSVQLYKFDLSDSNVFFLWLHSGDGDEQGINDSLSVTSHYFNITDPGSTTTGSSTSVESTTSQSSGTTMSSSTAKNSITTTDEGGTTSSATTSFTATGTSSTTLPGSQTTELSTATRSTTSTLTANPTNTSKPGSSGGLSITVLIIIIVVSCVIGLALIIGCGTAFWYLGRRNSNNTEKPKSDDSSVESDQRKMEEVEISTQDTRQSGPPELHGHSLEGELLAEPFARGQFQELRGRMVRPKMELLAEPFFRGQVPELHNYACEPELGAEPVLFRAELE